MKTVQKMDLAEFQAYCHKQSFDAGWYCCPYTLEVNVIKNFGEQISLIHSELSEALEANRKGLNDDHLPDRLGEEVELADAVIRIFDLAGARGYDLAGAIAEKLAYNKSRSDHKLENRKKEGGKLF